MDSVDKQHQAATELASAIQGLSLVDTQKEPGNEEVSQSQQQRVGYVYDEIMLQHFTKKHPERPSRIKAIFENLQKKGLLADPQLVQIPALPASDDSLQLVHSKEYVDKIKAREEKLQEGEGKSCQDSMDCYENKFTAKAALYAAGGTVEAVRAIMRQKSMGQKKKVDTAFCIVRPPGHHAFCS